MPLISIEQAIEDIKAGKMVILVDDEDRENEGDLTLAAEPVTAEAVNFMAKFGSGLICLTMTAEKSTPSDLPPMVGTIPQTSAPASRFRLKRAAASQPGFRRQTAPLPSGRQSPRQPNRPTWSGPGIYSPCGPRRAVLRSAPARQRGPLTWPAWPD